jgi:hypothetical protein
MVRQVYAQTVGGIPFTAVGENPLEVSMARAGFGLVEMQLDCITLKVRLQPLQRHGLLQLRQQRILHTIWPVLRCQDQGAIPLPEQKSRTGDTRKDTEMELHGLSAAGNDIQAVEQGTVPTHSTSGPQVTTICNNCNPLLRYRTV